MLAPFPANEYTEHEVFMQDNTLFPIIKSGNCDFKIGAYVDNGRRPLEVCGQYGKNEDHAVSAIRDNDIGEDGMGTLTGQTEDAFGADC